MFRARRRCKILAGVLVEYVEDDFAPTTQLWTIAADRSRIIILQMALMDTLLNILPEESLARTHKLYSLSRIILIVSIDFGIS